MTIDEVKIVKTKSPIEHYFIPVVQDKNVAEKLEVMNNEYKSRKIPVTAHYMGKLVAVLLDSTWRRGRIMGFSSNSRRPKVAFLDLWEEELEVGPQYVKDLVGPWNKDPNFVLQKVAISDLEPIMSSGWSISSLSSVHLLLNNAKRTFIVFNSEKDSKKNIADIVTFIPDDSLRKKLPKQGEHHYKKFASIKEMLLENGHAKAIDDFELVPDPRMEINTCIPIMKKSIEQKQEPKVSRNMPKPQVDKNQEKNINSFQNPKVYATADLKETSGSSDLRNVIEKQKQKFKSRIPVVKQGEVRRSSENEIKSPLLPLHTEKTSILEQTRKRVCSKIPLKTETMAKTHIQNSHTTKRHENREPNEAPKKVQINPERKAVKRVRIEGDTSKKEDTRGPMPLIMPRLALVDGITFDRSILSKTPSSLIWWDDEQTLTMDISFRGILDGCEELNPSFLYLRVEAGNFSLQYRDQLKMRAPIVEIEDFYFRHKVIPKETTKTINGLTLTIILKKAEEFMWETCSPFVCSEGQPLKPSWVHVNPMKVGEDSESSKEEDLEVDWPANEKNNNDMKNESGVLSWGSISSEDNLDSEQSSDDNEDDF